MGYSRVCRFCWRVAYSDSGAPTECGKCEAPAVYVDKHQFLMPMLWSVLSQYQVVENSPVNGVVDDNGDNIVFDFVVPECRIAIDFIDDDQLLSSEPLDGQAERIALDDAKESGTRAANYRWITLPTNVAEARSKLLEKVNEVYVKEVDGKLHILTPRLQGDAGWDLVCDEDTVCPPGVGTDIPSQVFLEIPNHLYAIVQARSSTSKKRLLVLPGVIDPAYRGQIFTMTFNPTSDPVMVKKGDRISQLLFFYRIPHLHVDPVYELRKSERGSRGFGSTGG